MGWLFDQMARHIVSEDARIMILKDGPYVVTGSVPLSEKIITPGDGHLVYKEGKELPQSDTYALCRCGKSLNPPFCDGAHIAAGFDGTETADRAAYNDRAEIFEGPELDLYDDNRCAFARFCHEKHGDVWGLTDMSDNPLLKEEAISASTNCPAGRLVHRDKETGEIIEPRFEPGIEVLQDPERKVSAPLYVKGGIPVESSDGFEYEVRNRVALCRCGSSRNKPFCDAMHVSVGFKD